MKHQCSNRDDRPCRIAPQTARAWIGDEILRSSIEIDSFFGKTARVSVGEVWPGTGDKRLFLAKSGNNIIYLNLNDGNFYWQTVLGFKSDLVLGGLTHDLSRRLRPLKGFLNVTAKFLIGFAMAANPVAFWTVMALKGVDAAAWVEDNWDDFDLYIAMISSLLTVRKTLQRYSPDLWDKLFWGVFLVLFKDSVKKIPSTLTAESIAEFIGSMIGSLGASLGKELLEKGLFTTWTVIKIIVKKVLVKFATSIPTGTGGAITEYKESAHAIVQSLKGLGVAINEGEVLNIFEQVHKNWVHIKPAMDKLQEVWVVGTTAAKIEKKFKNMAPTPLVVQ